MNRRRIVCIFILLLSCSRLFGDAAYPHFSGEELKLKNDLIKALKTGDRSLYEDHLLNCPALFDALEICESGLSERLEWDGHLRTYDGDYDYYLAKSAELRQSSNCQSSA